MLKNKKMSFSHSGGSNHSGSGSFDEGGVEFRIKKRYEERIRIFEVKINGHLEEIEHKSEEIVMWREKHMHKEEECRELRS